jgi:hypothetical protein
MKKLVVTQHEPRSIWGWYQEFLAGRLDVAPSFQRRGNLWSPYKRAHLIDSVINDFDIPKLYVADFTFAPSALNEKHRPYAVVDGRQRFEAFFGFFKDELPLNRSAILEDDPGLKIGGLRYSQLKAANSALARKIEDFSPVVMSIITDDSDKISEMFVRLNSGEAANSAERRNAKPGPIPELIREMVGHPFFANRIRFNKHRMAEFNLAAKLLMLEHRGGFVDTKATNLDRFVMDAARETGGLSAGAPTPEQVVAMERYMSSLERCTDTLETMSAAFGPRDPLLASAGHIPVYYKVIKDHPEAADNFRDFLDQFTRAVDMTRENSRSRVGPIDNELLVYYTFSRTTNDQRSLRERYDILVSRMKKKNLINQKTQAHV